MAVNPIPRGYHTITPYMVVEDATRLIEFMTRALGAEVVEGPMTTPDGRIMHVELQVGDSRVMMGEASEEWKPMPAMLYLYVPDTDAVFGQAVAAGATAVMKPSDQFYGDRNAMVKDPAGNLWCIATHVEDVAPEEMMRRAQERMQHA